jgi:hypothetical protein
MCGSVFCAMRARTMAGSSVTPSMITAEKVSSTIGHSLSPLNAWT